MDEFKKYLLTQKDQLESEEPSEKVWAGVYTSINVPVKQFSFRRWSIAASLILLTGTGILMLNKFNQVKSPIVKSSIKENVIPDMELENTKTKLAAAEKKPITKSLHFLAASPITTIHTVKELNTIAESKLNSMEASFTQVINMQKARISTTPIYAESPNYFSEFQHQLGQMEKDEAQIKSYIRKNGMSDELLDQLINVYQQKLNMLKLLQTEMQKLNSRYKQNRPAIDTINTYFLNL